MGAGIVGVGIDLVENDRMRRMLERWGSSFKDRVFLTDEQAYCDSKAMAFRHYAARFAVKEAVSKAFGTGLGPHLGFLDMEVMRNHQTGEPSVRLLGKAEDMASGRGVSRIMISLSHTHNYAVAQAVLVSDE